MMFLKVTLFSYLVQLCILGVSSNVDEIRLFLNNVLQCIERLQGEPTDSFVHERLYGHLRDHIQTLSGFLSISRFVEDSRNRVAVNTLDALHGSLQCLLTAHETRQRARAESSNDLLPPPVMTGHQGRPRYNISQEQVSHLVSLGMNWQTITTCLGVSCRTLQAQTEAWCSAANIFSTVKWEPEQSCSWNSSVYHKCRGTLCAWQLEVSWTTHSKVAC